MKTLSLLLVTIIITTSAFALEIERKQFEENYSEDAALNTLSDGFAIFFINESFTYANSSHLCFQAGQIKNCRSDERSLELTIGGQKQEISAVVDPNDSFCTIFSTGSAPYGIGNYLITYFISENQANKSVLFSSDGRFRSQDAHHSIFTFSCQQGARNREDLKVSDLLNHMQGHIQFYIPAVISNQ